MSPVRLTSEDARRVFATVINYPLFVPDLGDQVTRSLVSGDLARFVDDIERLSSLGSRPAAALLAYLHLKAALEPVANLQHAETLCSDGAHGGDPYSQYVLGWVCRAAGRNVEAMEWLRRAAMQLFSPAAVDIARFMSGGVGVQAADVRAALAALWDAHRLGHRMALVYIAELLRKHSESRVKKGLGTGLYPLAIVRATRFHARHPLSDRSFVTSLTTKLPLFKIPVRS